MRRISYSSHEVLGHIAKDELIAVGEHGHRLHAEEFEFLAVSLNNAPVAEDFLLKGLLGLSTSVLSVEDLGTELEYFLAGPLFMDYLFLHERILKN